MKFKNIFEEEIKDRYILPKDEIYKEIHEILYENSKNILKLNNEIHSLKDRINIIEQIIGEKIDESVEIMLPFYTDFGKHIIGAVFHGFFNFELLENRCAERVGQVVK